MKSSSFNMREKYYIMNKISKVSVNIPNYNHDAFLVERI
ncbi:hypothetical protein BD94_3319 [Elizabethkingia anophelis NUHP1]|uniref:Uncharacterized protein n=1 Tax=Elizabethkingia anophelis NUHP1 TaxID=1338011 RepID=A0A077ELM8_9FLAO|nr:hypothetical protein BD94_3319 [Elizabethkingia anophelis NUHP1]